MHAMPVKDARSEAVVFIDIVGSTNIMNTYGGYHFFSLFRFLEDIANRIFSTHNCLFRKGLGDGFIAVFENNEDAVLSSIEMLAELEAYNSGVKEKSKLELRIGIDFGETNVGHDGDRIGIAVTAAKRIEGLLAESFSSLSVDKSLYPIKNRIFISYIVYNSIRKNSHIACREIGWAELKGLEGVRYDIFLVDWKASWEKMGG
ncbi:MAG: adenylate/guanylate cyclase domain-containing protein [Nitrospinae bacterium]|nr:adenylate/guanylate cyclase domain-containing protein [Nitrospinota bacterium]